MSYVSVSPGLGSLPSLSTMQTARNISFSLQPSSGPSLPTSFRPISPTLVKVGPRPGTTPSEPPPPEPPPPEQGEQREDADTKAGMSTPMIVGAIALVAVAAFLLMRK